MQLGSAIGGILLTVTLLSGCGQGGKSESSIQSGADAGTSVPRAKALASLPTPNASRLDQVLVPAGDDIFMMGGTTNGQGERRAAAGAAIFSAKTQNWKDVKLPFSDDHLLLPGAVWTGDELIVAGTPCSEKIPTHDSEAFCDGRDIEVAAYSPETDRWRKISQLGEVGKNRGTPPLASGLGWTGRHAVFRIVDNGYRTVLYDVAKDTWTEVPTFKDEFGDVVCVAGGALYAVNQAGGLTVPPKGSESGIIQTAKYNADANAWEALAETPRPEVGDGFTETYCENGEIVVVPAGVRGQFTIKGMLWFDPVKGTWDVVPEVPETFGTVIPARTNGARVLWPGFPATKYWVLEDDAPAWIGATKPIPGDVSVQSYNGELLVRPINGEQTGSLLDPVRYAEEQTASG